MHPSSRGALVEIVWIPRGDAPELNDAFFERAEENVGQQLLRRGRPSVAKPKRALKDWLQRHTPV